MIGGIVAMLNSFTSDLKNRKAKYDFVFLHE